MTQIASVHSFRRGVGKTTVAANMAAIGVQHGLRVGVMDLNLAAPSLHILFGLNEAQMGFTLNDFVWGNCSIAEAVYEVEGLGGNGRLFLIPASTEARAIGRILRGGYYVNFLADACHSLTEQLALDVLLLDTYAGLGEEVQLAMALADVVVTVMRPDVRDYVGTRTILELGQRLGVSTLALVVNEVPKLYEMTAVQTEVERGFGCAVTAVLPHLDEIMMLGSAGLFVNEYEAHEKTAEFEKLFRQLSVYNKP